jgi:hypothetical protein
MSRVPNGGFAGRVLVRWRRWLALSIGQEPHPIVKSAYLQGMADALDSLALAERERYALMHKEGDASAKRDAVMAHSLVMEAIRRARVQAGLLAGAEGKRSIGPRRLQRLAAELTYLCGEGRPDPLDFPLAGRNAAKPAPETSTDDDDQPRLEWYADSEERAGIDRPQRLVREGDDEGTED